MEYHDTRILIADENASCRAQIREALTRAGYRHLEEATGGDEALAKIDRSHPDIALIGHNVFLKLAFFHPNNTLQM